MARRPLKTFCSIDFHGVHLAICRQSVRAMLGIESPDVYSKRILWKRANGNRGGK